MIRSSVDLPEPLSPSTPIFAPWKKLSEMFSSTVLSGGWVRETPCMVKMYSEGAAIAPARLGLRDLDLETREVTGGVVSAKARTRASRWMCE